MASRWWCPRPLWAAVVVALVALPVALGPAFLLPEPNQRATSYFATSGVATAAGLSAGLALLVVGSTLAVTDRRGTVGWLAVLAGAVWFAPVWAGWDSGPPAVRSVAVVVAPLLVPVLVHLAASASRGHPVGAARRAVAAMYVLVTALALGRALVHDPQRDRFCWLDCGTGANVLLVQAHTGLARALGTALLLVTLPAAVATVVVTAARLMPRARGRRSVAAVAVPAALALVGEAGTALVLVVHPGSGVDAPTGDGLFLLRAAALGALAAGVAWTSGDLWATRARMAALVHDLGATPASGGLRTHLARSLRDDTLELRYWSARRGAYVDASGGTPAGEVGRRTAARVVRGREPVAMVLHDPARGSQRALEHELGPAVRLALDNERLRVERLVQAQELRLSRARVAASADDQRSALERDLHDGAQQRLIAAAFELRLARADALEGQDVRSGELLDAAVEAATQALEELRDFAHGVSPAVLDQAGLQEAVWSLVDTVPVAVDVECRLGDRRRGTAVERTAYLVVRAALESPGSAGCNRTLRLVEEGQVWVIEASGIGPVDLLHLADRVGAVGGSLEVDDHRVRAVIP